MRWDRPRRGVCYLLCGVMLKAAVLEPRMFPRRTMRRAGTIILVIVMTFPVSNAEAGPFIIFSGYRGKRRGQAAGLGPTSSGVVAVNQHNNTFWVLRSSPSHPRSNHFPNPHTMPMSHVDNLLFILISTHSRNHINKSLHEWPPLALRYRIILENNINNINIIQKFKNNLLLIFIWCLFILCRYFKIIN